MLVLLLMANALACDLECVLNCQAQNEATTCGPLCDCPSTHEMFSLTVDSQTYHFPVLQETERLWAQQRFDYKIDSVAPCRQTVGPAEQLAVFAGDALRKLFGGNCRGCEACKS